MSVAVLPIAASKNGSGRSVQEIDEQLALADLFPELYMFNGAADRFLRAERNTPLAAQLRSRRIVQIAFVDIFESCLVASMSNNLCAIVEATKSAHDQAVSLGRQLAHTFHYNITRNPPTEYFLINDGSLARSVRSFCDVFARMWLAKMSIRPEMLFMVLEKQQFNIINLARQEHF